MGLFECSSKGSSTSSIPGSKQGPSHTAPSDTVMLALLRREQLLAEATIHAAQPSRAEGAMLMMDADKQKQQASAASLPPPPPPPPPPPASQHARSWHCTMLLLRGMLL